MSSRTFKPLPAILAIALIATGMLPGAATAQDNPRAQREDGDEPRLQEGTRERAAPVAEAREEEVRLPNQQQARQLLEDGPAPAATDPQPAREPQQRPGGRQDQSRQEQRLRQQAGERDDQGMQRAAGEQARSRHAAQQDQAERQQARQDRSPPGQEGASWPPQADDVGDPRLQQGPELRPQLEPGQPVSVPQAIERSRDAGNLARDGRARPAPLDPGPRGEAPPSRVSGANQDPRGPWRDPARAQRDGRGDRGAGQQRLDRQQQERRISEERDRAQRFQYGHQQHQRLAEQRARALQQQQRLAHYRYQQQYYDRLRLQQARWDARRYDHYNDPYFYTPASYRYSYGGRWHETNRYGADLMRQAVNYGYQEGLRAGHADRFDGWRNDYRGSYAYQHASYGYNGYYLDQSAYNHYFRQGFARGYDDGYGNRHRHGRRDDNGQYVILAAVLGAILGLQLLH